MAPHICRHHFKISSTSWFTTIKTNLFFKVMFFRPENKISSCVKSFELLFSFITFYFTIFKTKNLGSGGSAGSAVCNPQFSNALYVIAILIRKPTQLSTKSA